MSARFSRCQRLLQPADFQAVFDDARFRASQKYLLILAKPRNEEKMSARLGLVIAKKNIRLAVDRNRIKRLVRENFRLQQSYLKGIDAIVLARRGLDQQSNKFFFDTMNEQWLIIRKQAARACVT